MSLDLYNFFRSAFDPHTNASELVGDSGKSLLEVVGATDSSSSGSSVRARFLEKKFLRSITKCIIPHWF